MTQLATFCAVVFTGVFLQFSTDIIRQNQAKIYDKLISLENKLDNHDILQLKQSDTKQK